jgi:alkanesulfonate monooxygenase SsuD/methylene tetrahydromethanopterin reductase-like flavin-dependent oxidoreductase (luciferase family)
VTERLRIGTGICLVAQRDPIVTAKEVATLDLLSGGRFTFGVGYGWNVPELEHHGVAWGDRREVVRDRVVTMRSLWADDVAASESAHAPFADSWAWPKPVQHPHPPVLLGAGSGPGRCRTSWPSATAGCRSVLAPRCRGSPQLHEAWRRAGREGEPSRPRLGTSPQMPENLAGLAELGVDEVSLWLPSAPADEVLPILDRYAALAEALA